MARYIVHLQNIDYNAMNAKDLLQKAIQLVDDPDVTVRDARVSSKNIEFDLSITPDKLKPVLNKLSGMAPVANCTEVVEKHLARDEAIDLAKNLFNSERYWECHEVLEGIWKQSSGAEKELLQGIILTCAAFVHSQKDEDEISISILRRAQEKLGPSQAYHGIDMTAFKKKTAAMIQTSRIDYFRI